MRCFTTIFNNRLCKQILALFFVSMFVLPSSAKGIESPADGLILMQSVQPMGSRKVMIRKDAIKVINYAQNVAFIAKAPDWRVYTYNEKRRLYVDTTLDRFIKKFKHMRKSMNVLQQESPEKNWVKEKQVTIDGVTTTLFFNDAQELGPDGSKSDAWRKYWVAYRDVFPRPVVRLLAAEYGVPNLGGVPIHFETFGNPDNLTLVYITSKLDGKLDGSQRSSKKNRKAPEKRTLLRTISVKMCRLADSEFEVPKGMKRVEKGHSHEVLMDEKADKAFKDMLKEPDFLFRGSK